MHWLTICKKAVYYTSLFILYILSTSQSHAFYTSQYQFLYAIDEGKIIKVQLNISLTNTRSDVYIDTFSFTSPKIFDISNIRATIEGKHVKIERIASLDTYEYIFSLPQVIEGNNSSSTLQITYEQNGLVNHAGNITEVMLPTLQNANNQKIDVQLSAPKNFDKKISISKPIPTRIEDGVVYWESVKTPVIYNVFGEYQLYEMQATYNLQNNNIITKKQTIALPPETPYQQVFVNSLNPAPSRVYIDIDGNYLAEYSVNAHSKKSIIYNSVIKVYSRPQQDMLPIMRSLISIQSDYLLTPHKHWNIQNASSRKEIASLATAEEIYSYVTKTLQYSFTRANTNVSRRGALEALAHPQDSVCMEFTDLFIAIARQKGIYAREIQGYGYSDDPRLRPLSLITDVLHSWPEYWDSKNEMWIAVDPTWENTSRIDYISSLDLNHIVFAIHGKDPIYPLPAGTYKTENSKDVIISVIDNEPETHNNVVITHTIKKQISPYKDYTGNLTISNRGNTYIKNMQVSLASEDITFNMDQNIPQVIAPYQEEDITFSYSTTNPSKNSIIHITLGDVYKNIHPIQITNTYERATIPIILGTIAILASIFVGRRLFTK